MSRTLLLLALAVLFLPGCKDPAKAAKDKRRDDLRALMHGNTDDPDIRSAMEKARATVGAGIPLDGKVSFPPREIADWMFNEDGKAVGGFMLRALKTKMTEDEWAKIAERITFKENQ